MEKWHFLTRINVYIKKKLTKHLRSMNEKKKELLDYKVMLFKRRKKKNIFSNRKGKKASKITSRKTQQNT